MDGSMLLTMGALVCMSRWDIPVCPGDVIICRRSCAEPGSGLFAAHFLPHDVTFSINRWYQVPPCGGNWLMCTSRSWGQMHSKPDRDHFLLIRRYCFTLCKEWISPNSYLCIYNKNCRQANGDNRHIVPDVLTGLDRDIRGYADCMRAHPSRCKQTRSAYPDVPPGTFGTCKQVLPITIQISLKGLRRKIHARKHGWVSARKT